MIDKDWRLQRYQRKDYTELVDFPVEIVGRDGMVRRYGFEDAVRLYQRRVTFAPMRYRDPDLVQAEAGHCRSRIDQLRRSYFYRHGWGTPEGQPGPPEVFGELAAFLRRVLRAEGRPDVRLDPLMPPRPERSAWRVHASASAAVLHLYVYRFDADERDAVRDAFFTALKRVERDEVDAPVVELAGDVGPACSGARLVAFHHTVDCGFILTSQGEHDLEPAASTGSPDDADAQPTAWEEALDAARHGEHEVALQRCREIVAAQPWHRRAYVLGAAVAAHVGEPLLCEDLATLGARYFPEEPMLRYYEGLAQLRSGRFAEAIVALEAAHRLDPRSRQIAHLWVVALVGRVVAARRVLRAWESRSRRALSPEAAALREGLEWRRSLTRGGTAAVAVGAVALMGGVPILAMASASLGLGAIGAGRMICARRARAVEVTRRFDDAAHGLRHVKRSEPRPSRVA